MLQDERDNFTIILSVEYDGYIVLHANGGDEPIAWFSSREGAEDWIYWLLHHVIPEDKQQ